jgi:HSP20 family protein
MLPQKGPLRDLFSLRQEMNRLIDESLGEGMVRGQSGVEVDMLLDVAESEQEYIIKASAPGVQPEDLEITISGNVVTIKGELKEEDQGGLAYLLRERHFGAFTRTISLPSPIAASDVQATMADGVLTLVLPKPEETRPRKIQVSGSFSTGTFDEEYMEANASLDGDSTVTNDPDDEGHTVIS